MERIIIVNPYENPQVVEAETDAEGQIKLEFLQAAVEGYIEPLYALRDHGACFDDVMAVVNEEGRLKGMKPCMTFEKYGTVLGPVVFFGVKRAQGPDEEDQWIGLTRLQIEAVLEYLG